ncbi:hypothetical protein AXW83_23435 [Bosea sp. PAMC 26642]|nr:hypothetical protein AXW83_23435 [Bosea sp. PAMC 26642]
MMRKWHDGCIARADKSGTGDRAMGETSATDLKLELDVLLRRAEVAVPADRMEAVLSGYGDLKRMCALLRQPRTAAAEPSNTFSLVTLMKGV